MSKVGFLTVFISLTFSILFVPPCLSDYDGPKFFIDRNTKGDLMLIAPTCKEVLAQLDVLRAWTASSREPLKPFPKLEQSDDQCSAVLSGSIPKFVSRFASIQVPRYGPNCANTALVSQKILPTLRYVNMEELLFWITSPLCREVPLGQPIHSGDIIVAGTYEHGEALPGHVITYVSNELSFEKMTTNSRDPFLLRWRPFLRTFCSGFNTLDECRIKSQPRDSNHSGYYNQFFRCMPFARYMNRIGGYPTEELKDFETELLNFELQVQEQILHRESLPNTENFPATLKHLRNIVARHLRNDLNRDSVFWRMFSVQIESLSEQLVMFPELPKE